MLTKRDHRGGRAPLRTATELSVLMPIPILLIVDGHAVPLFPGSDRAAPSSYVEVILTRSSSLSPLLKFPLRVNGKQWEEVIYPILSDEVVVGWRGRIAVLGDLITLLNDIVGQDGTTLYAEDDEIGRSQYTKDLGVGRLYGDTTAFITQ